MEIEREMVIEAAVSTVGVGVFVALLVLIGVTFTDDGLTEQGAFALVGSIVVFVLLMAAVGFWLSGRQGSD